MADPPSCEPNPREVRIGRILSDLHERQRRGEPIDDEQILAEHSDLADDLRPQLATLRQLRSDDGSITKMIRQGVLSPSRDQRYRATLGDYQIIDYVGHGGMGVVLRAFDEKLRRVVAIKLLRHELVDDDIAKARFVREARAAASLSHPNIISVFAVGEQGGTQFIAMEYAAGPSLSYLIRQSDPMPSELIRSVFTQLLEGLEAAHAAGLIHRDIKSANLMLDQVKMRSFEDGGVAIGILKIADFGLARLTSSQTRLTLDNQSFGTPEFMSPEQARGDADIDYRTDLYSAGVVLYEMLTGRTPFRASSSSAVIRQIIDVAPPDPRSIRPETDPTLSSLALRLMAKKPEDRFASAADVMDALKANRPVTDREKWRRRAWMGARCIVAISVVAGVALVSRSITQRFTTRNKISAVRSQSKRYLQAMMEGGENWQLLHTFPEPIQIHGTAIADVNGEGDRIAIAAISPPENGDCLIAFESSGRERWRENLFSPRHWPDCSSPNGFAGLQVLAYPLDDVPGDELIVVASDINQYPTRVSILDPRTNPPRVRGTFWNIGDIPENDPQGIRMQMVEDFFSDHRPAILVSGMNNKLDGFEHRDEMTRQFWTKWNIVPAVMILDPAEILRLGECVGPPATDLIDLPRGGIYAYAFLDLAMDTIASTNLDVPGRRPPRVDEQGEIYNIQASGPGSADGSGPRFSAELESKKGDGMVVHLDRNLSIKSALTAPSRLDRSEVEWRKLWVPIIQEGRWLEARAMSSKP